MEQDTQLEDAFGQINWYLEDILVDGNVISLTKVFSDENKPNKLTGYRGADHISRSVLASVQKKLPEEYRENKYVVQAFQHFMTEHRSSKVISHSRKMHTTSKGVLVPNQGEFEITKTDKQIIFTPKNLDL